MTEYLDPAVDESPPRPTPRSAHPHDELMRAQADYDALLDWWERRYPVSGPRSRWDINADRLTLARTRIDAARRAIERAASSPALG